MLKIACIGAGYFAPFHIEAWIRIPEASLVAICDMDSEKAQVMAHKFRIPYVYTDVNKMLSEMQPDVVDIITPPSSHLEICQLAADKKIHIICQKPLAPSLSEAKAIIEIAQNNDVRMVVHENFRFQPWYRKIKELLNQNAIGDQIHQLYFRMRTGDGWQSDAYLNRQPYFRKMPRLLVYETGIHFIDTFRFLLGEIKTITGKLRRLNPDIKGEDCAVLFFEFENGAFGVWDANRFNESKEKNTRYTFGELLLEGDKGSIRLYQNGALTLQILGQPERPIDYHHENRNFAGDCVYYTQKHFVHCLLHSKIAETEGVNYLKNLEWQEHIYNNINELSRDFPRGEKLLQ